MSLMRLKVSAGDTIALVAPARKVLPEEMQPAIDWLEEKGFKVKEGPNLYAAFHQFAGQDAQRLADFQQALSDETVKAILFARGGYGTVRLIDNLDFTAFRSNPKWLIGFSDLTVVHSHVHRHFQIPTLHAPMAINFAKAEKKVPDALFSVLTGADYSIRTDSHPLNRQGSAQGILVGGNLSVLYSLLGSNSDVDTTGKILFIEDLDEYLYHVDRMMMALKRAGKLSVLKGLVVGAMSEMKDNTIPFGFTAEQIIYQCIAEYDYPVCFGFPAGHIPANMPLILGAQVSLRVQSMQTELDFHHGQSS